MAQWGQMLVAKPVDLNSQGTQGTENHLQQADCPLTSGQLFPTSAPEITSKRTQTETLYHQSQSLERETMNRMAEALWGEGIAL